MNLVLQRKHCISHETASSVRVPETQMIHICRFFLF